VTRRNAQNETRISLCCTTWHDFWHPRVMKGLPGVGLKEPARSQAAHCLFAALFRASPILEQAVDAALAQAFDGPPPPFVAAHLRLGGLLGEPAIQSDPGNPAAVTNAGSPLVQQHATHVRFLFVLFLGRLFDLSP